MPSISESLAKVPTLLQQAKEDGVDLELVNKNQERMLGPCTVRSLWQIYLLGGRLPPNDISDIFDFRDGLEGRHPLHYAAISGNAALLNDLILYAAEANIPPKQLLEIRDNEGRTMAHYVAKSGNVDAIRRIISLAETAKIKLHTLLTLRDGWAEGGTMIDYAIQSGNLTALYTIIAVALKANLRINEFVNAEFRDLVAQKGKQADSELEKILSTGMPLNELLEISGLNGKTLLHYAAHSGNAASINAIFYQAKKLDIPIPPLLKLQSLESEKTMTDYAAESGSEAIKAIFLNAQEAGVKFSALSINNHYFARILYFAALKGNAEAIKIIISQAKSEGITFFRLLQLSVREMSFIHHAALNGQPEAIREIVSQAKEAGVTFQELLEMRSPGEKNIAHLAAASGHAPTIELIISLADEVQIPFNKLLEEKDKNDGNMAHYTAFSGQVPAIKTIILRAQEVGITFEQLLKMKDSRGRVMMHYAAQSGKIPAILFLISTAQDAGLPVPRILKQKDDDERSLVDTVIMYHNISVAFPLIKEAQKLGIKLKDILSKSICHRPGGNLYDFVAREFSKENEKNFLIEMLERAELEIRNERQVISGVYFFKKRSEEAEINIDKKALLRDIMQLKNELSTQTEPISRRQLAWHQDIMKALFNREEEFNSPHALFTHRLKGELSNQAKSLINIILEKVDEKTSWSRAQENFNNNILEEGGIPDDLILDWLYINHQIKVGPDDEYVKVDGNIQVDISSTKPPHP